MPTTIHTAPRTDKPATPRDVGQSSSISTVYAHCAGWLTYREWKRLHDRAAARRRHAPKATQVRDILPAILASPLKKPVKATLAVMHDYADHRGHLTITRAHLANLLGISDRTVRRHWALAEEAGFLTRYDHPEDLKRPSEFWLWPGNAPRLDTFPEPEPFEPATGPAPF